MGLLHASLLLLCLAPTVTIAHGGCGCFTEELRKEHEADLAVHDCRTCSIIDVDAARNCPAMGYQCDEDAQLTSRVPTTGCHCTELKCSDNRARLAVNGTTVDKVSCRDREWHSFTTGEQTTSAVCAKPCGRSVCHAKSPNPALKPLVVLAPSVESPCAHATCITGYFVLDNDGQLVDTIAKSDLPQISCESDGHWNLGGERRAKFVGCDDSTCPNVSVLEGTGTYADFNAGGPIEVNTTGVNKFASCPPGSILYEVSGNSVIRAVDPQDAPVCGPEASQWTTASGPATLGGYKCLKDECLCFDDTDPDSFQQCWDGYECIKATRLGNCSFVCPENQGFYFGYDDLGGFHLHEYDHKIMTCRGKTFLELPNYSAD